MADDLQALLARMKLRGSEPSDEEMEQLASQMKTQMNVAMDDDGAKQMAYMLWKMQLEDHNREKKDRDKEEDTENKFYDSASSPSKINLHSTWSTGSITSPEDNSSCNNSGSTSTAASSEDSRGARGKFHPLQTSPITEPPPRTVAQQPLRTRAAETNTLENTLGPSSTAVPPAQQRDQQQDFANWSNMKASSSPLKRSNDNEVFGNGRGARITELSSPNRPGLQEQDASTGYAKTPHATYTTFGGRPSPRKEDMGAGASNALPPKNFCTDHVQPTPAVASRNVDNGGLEPMSISPMVTGNDMFTPPNVKGSAGASINNAGDQLPFKTGEHKNRRKGGETPVFASTQTTSATTNNNNNNAFPPVGLHSFPVPDPMATAPPLDSGHVPTPTENSNADSEPILFHCNMEQGTSRRGKKMHSRRNTKKSSAMPSSTTTAPVHRGPFPPPVQPISVNQDASLANAPPFEAVFNIGVGSTKSPRGRARASRRNKHSAFTSPSVASSGPSFSQEAMDQRNAAQPNISVLRDHFSKTKDEAKELYDEMKFLDAIDVYTHGIRELSASPAASQCNDLMAKFFSSRSGALFMIGAFHACVSDCESAYNLVDTPLMGSSIENLPVFQMKLLIRAGRACLRLGLMERSTETFDTALRMADSALASSQQCHSPPDLEQMVKKLESMKADAGLGKCDVKKLREHSSSAYRAMQLGFIRGNDDTRAKYTEALSDFNLAERIAPGSLKLQKRKVECLVFLKRWRETAGYLERLAASNAKMGGIFLGDNSDRAHLLATGPPKYMEANIFKDAREETPQTCELKVGTRASTEVLLWIPVDLIPVYLRALRLEERYVAAEACLGELEEFVMRGNSRFDPSSLQHEFGWLHQEKYKLRQSKEGRERGDKLFRANNHDGAAAQYSHCLLVDSDGKAGPDGANAGGRLHAVLHCNRAACLMQLGHYKDALVDCKHALRIHSQYMKALSRKARCLKFLDRADEALGEYRRYIQLAEQAKTSPAHSEAFITTCLFDGPKEVTNDTLNALKMEMAEVERAMDQTRRQAEAQAREESRRRAAFHEQFSQRGENNGNPAWRRREEWQNQRNDSRRWDSFRSRGPRSQSTRSQSTGHGGRNTHSSQENAGNSRSRSSRNLGSNAPTASTHYATLGVAENASDAQIKQAYRRLARETHPDKSTDPNANEKFLKIKNAHDVLKDVSTRDAYDRSIGVRRRH